MAYPQEMGNGIGNLKKRADYRY